MIQDSAVSASQAAVIFGAHMSIFAVNRAFAPLQAAGFAGGELAASYALRDAVLLVFPPLVDVPVLAETYRACNCEKSDA